MRHLFLPGLAAAAAFPLAAPAQALGGADQPERPPDAHMLRPPRGDVIEVREGILAPDHYVAPRADWRYRPLRAGARLHPDFYAARYQLADVARFRLPAARGSRRWIRYGNDLLLVDIGNGRIVRVVSNGYRQAQAPK